MEIILLQDIDKVGDKFSIVPVKNGYGRNYLIPQGMALIANKQNRNRLTELMKQDERRENKRLDEYRTLVTKLEGKRVTVLAKAGTSGRIFGAVNNQQVAKAIEDQLGVKLERKKVVLNTEVKELGNYEATIQLNKEISTTVTFEVMANPA